ncbi:MAG: hypothetical protein A2600_12385 [Candidatus Lambdaproteobacteria bacterium RIFOXYD1_FULL_56_27]|uniref:Uncharacterized protein n=1 Tax=Candidatus Lambdaproteobacteria bacterium RIFOXYD2_FULL_56_26 TaxID=1817773 RepID=A0A1F6H1X1_9PROT|nr:MAG: hypothetical protein A2426_12505 [Candidatus Lambdaproteobacteria bacterium RIFOXYC1_FULL_56_13]OGH04383.1 MAG: hypothetical protein A2557_11085 [Candidatus Lambdaproteobacteria bacterium RIFOXYD2_FULL_56_26]OGH08166.1 MAG: hypothetical protein A2600_12385 [Candidatus Lambdaproteobacteria bacterium RIFOXYD1_FULL_56_27]
MNRFYYFELGRAILLVGEEGKEPSARLGSSFAPNLIPYVGFFYNNEPRFLERLFIDWRAYVNWTNYDWQYTTNEPLDRSLGVRDAGGVNFFSINLTPRLVLALDFGLQLYAGPTITHGTFDGNFYLTHGEDRSSECEKAVKMNSGTGIRENCERVHVQSTRTASTREVGLVWLSKVGNWGVRYRSPFSVKASNLKFAEQGGLYLFYETK